MCLLLLVFSCALMCLCMPTLLAAERVPFVVLALVQHPQTSRVYRPLQCIAATRDGPTPASPGPGNSRLRASLEGGGWVPWTLVLVQVQVQPQQLAPEGLARSHGYAAASALLFCIHTLCHMPVVHVLLSFLLPMMCNNALGVPLLSYGQSASAGPDSRLTAALMQRLLAVRGR